ncbi:hypothetical protein [Kribbella sindirgiensis]|uniref:PNPLA domain-containing protein n=1 Tax=Kribbella sindirgiensis TaxID=1124744 RepID=A0A4R0IEN8_9ACTN|nr:hypothetical protein [Kribbella sindirgiensis]TCC30464.1 hypothetical protein E0H50_23940 [Kribbella sindirgiensis]
MGILQDPPADGLTSDTRVSFHYWRRVGFLLAGVAVIVLAVVFLGDRAGDNDSSQAVWVVLLLIAVALSGVAVFTATRMQRNWHAGLRWGALILGAVVAAHFGDLASLKGQTRSIVQLELAGSSKAWTACACDPLFTKAVQQDFWFIVSYVFLLGLLASWTGMYFRLPLLRRARTTVVIAVVVAGVFDIFENVLMLTAGSSNGPWRFVAVFAWAKFALLVVAVVYSAAGAFAWWSTPRWVRLASWALPKYAQKAAGMKPKAGTPEEAEQAPEGNQMQRTAPPPGEAKYGIALSGGGIRASSISLGALQALDDQVLSWSGARAVTAVSGGSNMAAGWSISRSSLPATDTETTARAQLRELAPRPWQQQENGWLTPEERHLVDNLGYLGSNQPRGSDTDPAAARATRQAGPDSNQTSTKASYRPAVFATVIAGLTVNVIVLTSMLWAITRPLGWALRNFTDRSGVLPKEAMHQLVKNHSLSLPGLIFLGAGFAVLMLWVLAGRFLVGYAQTNKWARVILQTLKRASYGAFALGALLALALWGFVELVGAVAHLSFATLVATAGASAGVVGSVVRILRKPAARFAPMLGGIAFVVVGLGVTALATWTAAKYEVTWSGDDLFSWRSGWNWVLALVLLTIVLLGPSSESWSLAPFYRGKLRLAYATYRTEQTPGELRVQPYDNDVPGTPDAKREPGLSAFNYDTTAVRTPLVVCTTSTVTSRAVRTRYGTPALSVTFDPERTILHLPQDGRGNTLQFAASTRVLDRLGQKMHKRITTMMAVAISSAAVSPAMGRYQIGPTSMLLAFFNIRLGVWIANPRFITQLEAAGLANEPDLAYPRTGLGYLFKEFFGVHDLDDPYLYLTDGGHWENTGLVELLRIPEITEIVCVDADSGPGDATSSLGKAIAIAPSECDIRIDISLDPLRAAPSGSRVPAYSPRTVNIGFFTKGAGSFTGQTPVGVLWYAKPGLAKEMPAALLAFHERYPTYPRESTLNQFFDTASFVAYRNFGRYNARQILLARQKLQAALTELLAIPDATLDEQLKAMAGDHWVIAELSRAAHSAATTPPLIRAYCLAVQTSLVS